MWTQIRLLKAQSDPGPHCLQKLILKSQADDKADDNCCDWQFEGYGNCEALFSFTGGEILCHFRVILHNM